MTVKCENVIVCGNYGCSWNHEGCCGQSVVAMDNTGKCVLFKPRPVVKTESSAPNKS